ncbi:MAG: helix-turn-helix domain-containing protein, partial [Flavitalea sp.]
KDREPMFKIELVGLTTDKVLKKGFYSVHNDRTIDDVIKTDLIIIPAMQGSDMENAVKLNEEYVPWLLAQHKRGAQIASLCLGSFLLASTGLLANKQCTTHWSFANEFRRMYPDVDLVPEKILIDENGIYSSGGALSFTNLLLYLIEKYAGRDIAVLASKTFMIDIDRDRQSPFIIFKAQKDHEDEPIRRAQDYIEKNYAEKISVDEIASMFALGRRNLERRFKKATSNTVVEYIQRVKIEAAKMSLETSQDNVNEVMYKVGYNDNKAFRTTFKKITGLSPVQYRSKFKAN